MHLIREHAEALTARQAIAESRKSRGFLAGLFSRSQDLYKPTYNHVKDGSACRIYGSLTVKRITGASSMLRRTRPRQCVLD
jgi:hypothetical protein